ncbi:MAG: ribbon-helix-helix protein, CopG family [Solirubrobacterales bacterium]|nr:ribbon-helix-helix protein, CopG family [Solirubrobacterales bacterium]
MVSFRVAEAEAEEAQRWAQSLGIDRSELLRRALAEHLTRLRTADEADRIGESPPTPEERSLAEISDWGPAEDWSDWADAAG